jgi:hypothetical protein
MVMTSLGRKVLFVSVALLGSAAGSNKAFAEWSAAVFSNQKGVNFHGKSVKGRIIFYGTCNTELKPGLGVTFEPYSGKALENIDDVSRPVIFVVKGHDGTTREFPAIMHYYEPEKAWVLNDLLPIAFMDEFGRGDLLTIRNARGDTVVEFNLNGAGNARETVRRVCHM